MRTFVLIVLTVVLVCCFLLLSSTSHSAPSMARSYNVNGKIVTINNVSSVVTFETYAEPGGCLVTNDRITMLSGDSVTAVYLNCGGVYSLYTFDVNGNLWEF